MELRLPLCVRMLPTSLPPTPCHARNPYPQHCVHAAGHNNDTLNDAANRCGQPAIEPCIVV